MKALRIRNIAPINPNKLVLELCAKRGRVYLKRELYFLGAQSPIVNNIPVPVEGAQHAVGGEMGVSHPGWIFSKGLHDIFCFLAGLPASTGLALLVVLGQEYMS